MTIRPARREELWEAAVMLNESWRFAYKDIIDTETLASLTDDKDRHERVLGCYDDGIVPLLLFNNDELLGYSRFGPSQTKGYPDDGEIAAIYIREDAIGKGYGHALLTCAENELCVQGYERIVIDVLSQNTKAIAFYQSHGYLKVGETVFNRNDKDYPLDIMRKSFVNS
jgi:ribosomal protein S18 acetylase RimI-like enzyme